MVESNSTLYSCIHEGVEDESCKVNITLGSNISALRGLRSLERATKHVRTLSERLSTGQRINSAVDDAAGLSIASKLSANSKIYAQAVRNINDGISLMNIAESAVHTLQSITHRQIELAEQAANGIYSSKERVAMNNEADALREEYNRIISTTSFNNIDLFADGAQNLSIQSGVGDLNQTSLTIGSAISRTVGTGELAAPELVFANGYRYTLHTGDFNGDGALDAFSSYDIHKVFLGNNDGTFSESALGYNTSFTRRAIVFDSNNDGLDDIFVGSNVERARLLLSNGDGTFSVKQEIGFDPTMTTDAKMADFNQDGIMDISYLRTGESQVSIVLGNADGTYGALNRYVTPYRADFLSIADLNNDGRDDLIISDANFDGDPTGSAVYYFEGRGDGTFSEATFAATVEESGLLVSDFNRDGAIDMAGRNFIALGNGDGTFKARTQHSTPTISSEQINIADMNGDGLEDIISTDRYTESITIALNNGDGTFHRTSRAHGLGNGSTVVGTPGDFDGDGAPDVIYSHFTTNETRLMRGITKETAAAQFTNLLTQKDARASLDILRSQSERLVQELGQIGAQQSRMEIAQSITAVRAEQSNIAASRILDADIAEDAAQLLLNTLLQEAGIAVLATANQQPALALQLLAGE